MWLQQDGVIGHDRLDADLDQSTFRRDRFRLVRVTSPFFARILVHPFHRPYHDGSGSCASPGNAKAEAIMGSRLSALKARVSNRLARDFFGTPLHLPADQPMVSFTFDDVPESAATIGAPMLEQQGGRGTFYVSGGLVNRWSGDWNENGANDEQVMRGLRKGHELGCIKSS